MFSAYTQIAARDQARSADVQFTVDDGDATLLIDKFQIARGSVTTSSQPTIDSQQIFTDQVSEIMYYTVSGRAV
jgi:hypothetical protein